MDVNDLKSLNAEVKKRMAGALEHLRHELAFHQIGRLGVAGIAPGRHPMLSQAAWDGFANGIEPVPYSM